MYGVLLALYSAADRMLGRFFFISTFVSNMLIHSDTHESDKILRLLLLLLLNIVILFFSCKYAIADSLLFFKQ